MTASFSLLEALEVFIKYDEHFLQHKHSTFSPSYFLRDPWNPNPNPLCYNQEVNKREVFSPGMQHYNVRFRLKSAYYFKRFRPSSALRPSKTLIVFVKNISIPAPSINIWNESHSINRKKWHVWETLETVWVRSFWCVFSTKTNYWKNIVLKTHYRGRSLRISLGKKNFFKLLLLVFPRVFLDVVPRVVQFWSWRLLNQLKK